MSFLFRFSIIVDAVKISFSQYDLNTRLTLSFCFLSTKLIVVWYTSLGTIILSLCPIYLSSVFKSPSGKTTERAGSLKKRPPAVGYASGSVP